jgi:hypothetical protein
MEDEIKRVTTLLSPTEDGRIKDIKQKLFFFLAYCDTYHDFSSDRPVKGEGKSVSKGDVGNRSEFIKTIITMMEGAESAPFIQLIEELKTNRGYTFENNVCIDFSSLPNSYILNKFSNVTPVGTDGATSESDRSIISNYLYSIHSLPIGTNQQTEYLKKNNFISGVPEAKASLIDIYIPASNYSDGVIPVNLIKFFKKVFIEYVDKDALKFVEDAASFPRELFGGHLLNFRKIVTTQTKWDPAGLSLSQFEANNTVNKHKVMAPSFLAANGSSAGIDEANLSQNYFNQTTDRLILQDGQVRNINKAGPSVNHLFMHMILEKSTLPELIKNKYKQMIKVSKLDSKKNLVEPLLPGAGNQDAYKDQRLRKLTTSKRTGDYENIHSAIEAGALMITGDEPAFTYAKMNKCPAIYHINTKANHTFKLYIPPPINETERRLKIEENLMTGLILQSLELRTLFGATTEFYKGYLNNLKEVIFSGDILVAGRADLGRLLQAYFIKEINENQEFFNDLKTACKLYKTLTDIDPADIKGYSYADLLQLVESETALVNDLMQRNAEINLSDKMNKIKKKIPSRFTVGASIMSEYYLFKPFDEEQRGEAFLEKNIDGYLVKYNFEPGTFFPEYKYLEGNFEGLARYLRINEKTTNQSLIAKNMRIIIEVLDDFGFNSFDQVNMYLQDNVGDILTEINRLIAPEGGRMHKNTKTTRNIHKLKLSKTKTAKNHTKHYYKSLHSKISRLNPSKIPFGFTPKEYADILVYRIIINNCIHRINMKNNSSKVIEESIKSKVSEEAMLPIQYTVQTAGELSKHIELHNYCVYLYTNSIEPFLKKHLFTDRTPSQTPRSVHQNFMLSVIGGSFLEDLEVLLGDIIGSPTFTSLDTSSSLGLFHGMIETASIAITSIFKKIYKSYLIPTSIIKIARETGKKGDVTAQSIINGYTYYINKEKYNDDFFNYVTDICIFLNNTIIYRRNGFNLERDAVEQEINTIIDHHPEEILSEETVNELRRFLEKYVKFAINDYIEFGDFEAAEARAAERAAEGAAAAAEDDGEDDDSAEAPEGEGGSFHIKPRIRRRKRNGSPRRLTLRNSLKHK